MPITERKGKNGISFQITVNRGYKFNANGDYVKDRVTTTYRPPKGINLRNARRLAKEFEAEYTRKMLHYQAEKEEMRFEELVAWYKENYLVNAKRPSTVQSELHVIRKHLMPYFGRKKLGELSAPMITEFLDNVSIIKGEDNKPLKPKQYYSDSYVKLIYSKLHSILDIAVKQGWIKENPSNNSIRPKRKIKYKKPPMEIEQVKDLLKRTEKYSQPKVLVKLLANTGFRIGEALALTWEDIDFENKTIKIDKSVTMVNNEMLLGEPKTENGYRTIMMNNMTYDILQEHKAAQQKFIKEFMKSRYNKKKNLVFARDDGEYLHRSTCAKWLDKITEGSGYEFISLHSLRHACATLLLNNGVDLKVVSNHLGHHDIGITADVYCDVLRSQKLKVANVLDIVLEKD